jgi:hypothetical protein
MIKRKPTWRSDLHGYLLSVWHKPFVWGEHDCGLFAAGAIEAMTGQNFAAEYRGRYTTLTGGLRLLKDKGFDTHADLAASLFAKAHPSRAGVGDLAAVRIDDAAIYALGVVQGARIYVLRPGENGIGTVDLLAAETAFLV